MNKIKNVLIGLVATISLTSVAYAGSFGLGVTGSYLKIDASGTESDAANTGTESSVRTKSVDNNAIIGSIYAEYSFNDASWAGTGNGITFGAKYTPGAADVSDKVERGTDAETSITGTVAEVSNTRTRTAQAEIDKYYNYYIELPVWKNLYVKAGRSTIDVTTLDTDNGTNAGTYPNATIDGTNLGVGFKGVAGSNGNIVWKLAYEDTNFDTLTLTSTTSNTIKADLDTTEVNLSLGFRF